MAKKLSLGSGLDDLFGDNSVSIQPKQTLRILDMEPNKSQPRKEFNEDKIRELADSINEFGLLQPIIVRPLDNGMYQIIAGERRWRACRMLGWTDREVPVIIQEHDDFRTAQIALVENMLRENLNPIDEAQAYNELIEQYDITQERLSEIVGKSRASITNAIRLLKLPDEVLDMVRDGDVSVGAAKVLLGVEDEELLITLAKQVKSGAFTVRQLEKAVSAAKPKAPKKENEAKVGTYYKEMEIALRDSLQRKVQVSYSDGKGKLTLEFYNEEDLGAIAKLLTKEN